MSISIATQLPPPHLALTATAVFARAHHYPCAAPQADPAPPPPFPTPTSPAAPCRRHRLQELPSHSVARAAAPRARPPAPATAAPAVPAAKAKPPTAAPRATTAAAPCGQRCGSRRSGFKREQDGYQKSGGMTARKAPPVSSRRGSTESSGSSKPRNK